MKFMKIENFLNIFASYPAISIFLRKIVEANFKKQKAVIKENFLAEEDDSVLDLGCGTGEFSVFFNPKKYTGIDIKKKNIDYARRKYSGEFLIADAVNLPFVDNSFNKILIIGVLHHLSDDDSCKVLKEAGRVLKKNGQMLIMEDIESLKDGFFTRLIHGVDQGKFIRTEDGYRKILSDNFSIEKEFGIKSGLCPYQVFVLNG